MRISPINLWVSKDVLICLMLI